jgi:hypothetical protein
MFILKMKALKPRCLRHSSKKKKNTGSSFLSKKKNTKIQFMEIAIFTIITDYLRSVSTRESAGMGWIYMKCISVCQRAEPLTEYTQVEDFFCSSHSLAMNEQEGTCLVHCSTDKGFRITYLQ